MSWTSILSIIGLTTVVLLAVRWQFWRLPKKGLLCLMYHHIGYLPPADWQYVFTITPERFNQQLDKLIAQDFTPLHCRDLLAGQNLPQQPLLITFDDGTLDTYQNLFPILQKRKVKVIVFLATDFIGTHPDYMTWEQVRQMQASGLVEFGSHTCSHTRLRQLPNDKILHELIQSKKVIEEKLQVPCLSFCYPFGAGAFDKRVRPLVFQAGYQLDFGTKQGINPWPYRAKHALKRVFPRGGETMTDFYIQITRGKSRF